MSTTEEFLDLYRQLEQMAVSEYHLPQDGSSISKLERMPQYEEEAAALRYCREVRALLTHNPRVDGEFAVVPSAAMLNLLRSLIERIGRPAKCVQIATPLDRLLTVGPEDRALPVIEKMLENGYAHIPILSDGRVVGILNETSLIRFSAGEGNVLNARTDMRELAPYTALAKQPKKYVFLASDASIHDAEGIFTSRFKRGERVAVILLTEHGTRNEPLVGMITPWDVMGI